MGNIIRAEVSEKNPYWIEKHRHYELKHFCLQYPIWKKAYSSLNGMLSRREALNAFGKARHVSNPTERIAMLNKALRKLGVFILLIRYTNNSQCGKIENRLLFRKRRVYL